MKKPITNLQIQYGYDYRRWSSPAKLGEKLVVFIVNFFYGFSLENCRWDSGANYSIIVTVSIDRRKKAAEEKQTSQTDLDSLTFMDWPGKVIDIWRIFFKIFLVLQYIYI